MKELTIYLYAPALLMLFLLNASCTGASLATMLGIKSNTHPVKEYGSLFIFTKGGYFYHGNSIPGQVGNGDFDGEKKIGKSCSYSYLYLVSSGDSSIQEACRQVKITKIISTQSEITALLGGLIYHKHCTYVFGIADGSWQDPEMIYQ